MERTLVLISIGAALIASVSARSGDAEPDPATRTIASMRVVGALFESYKEENGQLPDLGPTLVDPWQVADELGPEIGPDLQRLVSLRDGWGNRLRFLLTHDHYMIIDGGSDGEEDVDYGKLFESGEVEPAVETSEDEPERDIVFSEGEFTQRPRPKRSPAAQAIADMRSIGRAIESFAVDDEAYPGPTPGLQVIDILTDDLEPDYILQLPRLDPWEHPYLVWSDPKSYVIVCTGADGLLDDGDYGSGFPAAELFKSGVATTGPDADLVFANGQFVRWPRGGPHASDELTIH